MPAATGLNAGLFVGRDYKLIVFEGLAAPNSLVEIEQTACLGGETRVPREDPTAVVPGTNRILVEPPPDRTSGNRGDQAGLTDLPHQIRRIPVRERNAMSGRQLTSESFHLNDQFWGEKSGAGPGENAPPNRPDVVRRIVYATG